MPFARPRLSARSQDVYNLPRYSCFLLCAFTVNRRIHWNCSSSQCRPQINESVDGEDALQFGELLRPAGRGRFPGGDPGPWGLLVGQVTGRA